MDLSEHVVEHIVQVTIDYFKVKDMISFDIQNAFKGYVRLDFSIVVLDVDWNIVLLKKYRRPAIYTNEFEFEFEFDLSLLSPELESFLVNDVKGELDNDRTMKMVCMQILGAIRSICKDGRMFYQDGQWHDVLTQTPLIKLEHAKLIHELQRYIFSDRVSIAKRCVEDKALWQQPDIGLKVIAADIVGGYKWVENKVISLNDYLAEVDARYAYQDAPLSKKEKDFLLHKKLDVETRLHAFLMDKKLFDLKTLTKNIIWLKYIAVDDITVLQEHLEGLEGKDKGGIAKVLFNPATFKSLPVSPKWLDVAKLCVSRFETVPLNYLGLYNDQEDEDVSSKITLSSQQMDVFSDIWAWFFEHYASTSILYPMLVPSLPYNIEVVKKVLCDYPSMHLIIKQYIHHFSGELRDEFNRTYLPSVHAKRDKKALEQLELVCVKALMEAGIDLDVTFENGRTLLMHASFLGYVDSVSVLIEAGANLEVQDINETTALLLAVSGGDLACVKALIEAGADLEAMDDEWNTALLLAVSGGDLACVKALIEAGADLEVEAGAGLEAVDDGNAALLLAVSKGELACVKILIEAGADLEAIEDEWWCTALLLAVSGGDLACVKILVEAGADLEAVDGYGSTALLLAALLGQLAYVKLLVEAGADLEATDNVGRTALLSAVPNGRCVKKSQDELAYMKELVEAGADLEATDDEGSTALLLAVSQDELACVKLLIEAGVNLDFQDKYGMTALMSSASHGHLDCLKALVEAGVNLDFQDKYGMTALMSSASHGHLDCLKALVEAGADLEVKNKDGMIAGELAAVFYKNRISILEDSEIPHAI